jgi:hypothetical protein
VRALRTLVNALRGARPKAATRWKSSTRNPIRNPAIESSAEEVVDERSHYSELKQLETENFITLARVVKTQGRRGEVASEILSDMFPDDLQLA